MLLLLIPAVAASTDYIADAFIAVDAASISKGTLVSFFHSDI